MDRFDLIGHDWGGMLGWIVAARQPGRVRSLSVASTPHPLALKEVLAGDDAGPGAPSRSMDPFAEAEIPERVLMGRDGTGANLAALLRDTGLDEIHIRVYVDALMEPGALTAALNWFRAMDNAVLRDLDAVTVPTLYVWSSEDRAFSREAAQRTAHLVSGDYSFEVLDGVSHWIPETASEQLSSLVLAHLAAH